MMDDHISFIYADVIVYPWSRLRFSKRIDPVKDNSELSARQTDQRVIFILVLS